MPVVATLRDTLIKDLGKEYESSEKFQDLCFDFGVELEDYEEDPVKQFLAKFKDDDGNPRFSEPSLPNVYRVDVPANRYDLLCTEGLGRALRIFKKIDKHPKYTVIQPPSDKITKIIVQPAVKDVREFVVGAILRDIEFTAESYFSFLELQSKLHFNICRRRTLVSIGTHDLSTIKTPIKYDALPRDTTFRALKEKTEMTVTELFAEYKKRGLKDAPVLEYVPILDGHDKVPFILDANNVVCSLPPIINGDHSKMSRNTKDVFIEITATDRTKAHITLNTMVAMFSEYCKKPFTCEAVQVEYPDGEIEVTPENGMKPIEFKTTVESINRGAGIDLTGKEMVDYLYRMQLDAEEDEKGEVLTVRAPITRSDILHPVDIEEDVAIAFGYNNIKKRLPDCYTIARQQPVNKLSDLLRIGCTEASFTEVLNWVILTRDENFANMRRKDDGKTAAEIGLSKLGSEYRVCRTSLLPGLLKTVAHNVKGTQLPLRLFEIGDIVLLDDSNEMGARNERRLSAIYAGESSACFEIIHGFLDRMMQLANVKFLESEADERKSDAMYRLEEAHSDTFFPSRQATVLFRAPDAANYVQIGNFGILHPTIINNFSEKARKKSSDLLISALEINIEPLVDLK